LKNRNPLSILHYTSSNIFIRMIFQLTYYCAYMQLEEPWHPKKHVIISNKKM